MSTPIRGGLLGLIDALLELHARGESAVLGLVVATTGSTYQKPGALVLLDASGMRHGALSGGCLEPEVEARARTVLAARRAACLDLDTRSDDDLIFGSGTGCRGRIQLLLLPQPPEAPLTRALVALVGSNLPLDIELAIERSPSKPVTGSGCARLAGASYAWGADGRPTDSVTAQEGATVALSLPSPPYILLYGAGPETSALHLFWRRLGWRHTVIEHRGRWQRYARAAEVERLLDLAPDSMALVAEEALADAAILMTHNFSLDAAHLRRCAVGSLAHIGLLGPKARRDQLLAELGPELAAQLQGRLRAPVGLPLGGSGPEALAVAITAELQQSLFAAGRLR